MTDSAQKVAERMAKAVFEYLVMERDYEPFLPYATVLVQMAQSLEMLHDEVADYIKINHLGDTHHNRSMQLAHAALSAYRALNPEASR